MEKLIKGYIIVATSRVIKLFSNIFKILNHPLYWLFPKMRFTIPKYAKPLIRKELSTPIPRIIWQTNFTNQVTLPVYTNYLFNRLMAPSFEYRFMITGSRRDFIMEYYPEIIPHYDRLQIGAAQADLWRLLVLHKFGGVYLDIDAHQVWPLSSILSTQRDELYITTRRGELSNYFIASKPNNSNIYRLIEKVIENIKDGRLLNTFDITGPGVFTTVLFQKSVPTISYRYAVNQGNFTNEHFQYIDKPQGKWNKEQKKTPVIRPEGEDIV